MIRYAAHPHPPADLPEYILVVIECTVLGSGRRGNSAFIEDNRLNTAFHAHKEISTFQTVVAVEWPLMTISGLLVWYWLS